MTLEVGKKYTRRCLDKGDFFEAISFEKELWTGITNYGRYSRKLSYEFDWQPYEEEQEQLLPKYGDKIWVRDSEKDGWQEAIFAVFINGVCCTFRIKESKMGFEDNTSFSLAPYNHYRLTDPALDKKTLELTKEEALSRLAKFEGVEEIKIKN